MRDCTIIKQFSLFLILLLTSQHHHVVVAEQQGLCVVGCTPYVDDPYLPNGGYEKYEAMIQEMAETCQVIAHVGDTMPGSLSCTRDLLTKSLYTMVQHGKLQGTMVLYAPGDNELTDCHRSWSSAKESRRLLDRNSSSSSLNIFKAADARQVLIDDLKLNSGKDLTDTYTVINHDSMSNQVNSATCDSNGRNCQTYSCDFDKYVELDTYAIATLEVLGSFWYLGDEREDSPYQDEVDPLKDRLGMHVNAKDCALDWIEYAASTASANQKRAVFFLLHAKFYKDNGEEYTGTHGIGSYYSYDNLKGNTTALGDPVESPFQPFYDKLTEIALRYPELMFQVVHSDTHQFFTARLNPAIHNGGAGKIYSHHNMMIHETEGASRALTMYTRFTVDENAFQPITIKQEWSKAAFDLIPFGHSG